MWTVACLSKQSKRSQRDAQPGTLNGAPKPVMLPLVKPQERRYQTHLRHSRSMFAQREVVDFPQLLRTQPVQILAGSSPSKCAAAQRAA
ncbi:TPA: hypothetical protein ACH3X2_009930 [Trebouxia sp. C0005]